MTAQPEQNAPQNALDEPMISHRRLFAGFAPPTSNTTYTPNQFFDTCLPYRSRGCARLVGYMLRRTLGWSDAEGNPLEEQIVVSYSDLENHAGISRDMIRAAIDEAIQYHFIVAIREGRAKGPGLTAVNALYELAWDESNSYLKDPEQFRGFFAGEGNRTYIPNQFFDDVLRHESLSVAKVVGAVIRFSIGFQTKHGFRRKHVQLSYNHIQRYAQITGRTTLSNAIRTALEQNYIVRIQEGLFTPDTSRQITTTYSLKWIDNKQLYDFGQKIVPEPDRSDFGIGQKIVPGKSTPERSENRTRIGQKIVPENRSENRTSIEITTINNISKQQQPAPQNAGVAVAEREVVSLLKKQGFADRDAQRIAGAYPTERIQRQIDWLPARKPGKNPTGLLRKAIEDDYPAPPELATSQVSTQGRTFAAYFYAGLAGFNGEPITEPSEKDAALAQGFVDQILKAWNDEQKIPEWGRDFGKFVAAQCHDKKGIEPSLTFALTASRYATEFYKNLTASRAQKLKEANEQRRENHYRTHLNRYHAYLKAEFERLKKDHPDQIKSFESDRAAKRDQLRTWRHMSEDTRERMIAQQDAPENRRAAFEELFHYDFWIWDAEVNPNSFSEGGHAA